MISKGFTLLEMVVVIGIIAVVAGISMPFAISSYESQMLESTRASIHDALELAHNQAITQKNDSNSGVYFSPSFVSDTVYEGISYNDSGTNHSYDQLNTLPSGVTVTLSSVNVSDINFTKHTGIPNTTGTLVISQYGLSKDLLIDSFGNVSEQ